MSGPAFLAAVAARSPEAVRAALAPTFAGKANGRPLDGDAQVRLLEAFWAGFTDGAFQMDATGGSGHQVMTWTFAGTHDGIYLGIPPTGTRVTFSGFLIAVWNASGITSLDWKWDTKAFTRQVLGPEDFEGAFPAPPKHRPDPSIRWAREAQRSHGKRTGKGKPKGPKRQGSGQRQPRNAEPAAQPTPEATPAEPTTPPAPPEAVAKPDDASP